MLKSMRFGFALAVAVGFASGLDVFAAEAHSDGMKANKPRVVVNIVNFVRSLDVRVSRPNALIRTLREEVALNLKHKVKNTILFQYDALVDPELRAIAAKSDPKLTEYGLWFEMSRPLNEAAGVPWCPKSNPKWEWDWKVDPGFLMSYTPEQRKALIDAAFAKFKADFGYYPKSVGSWIIDAWSMAYMTERYKVDGICICREQDNTDAYGLRGGYSNGAYYPSKKNMLSAATDMANAIPVPVFKMLTPDPIYNYARAFGLYSGWPRGYSCPTLEPVWISRVGNKMADWFFRTYIDSPGILNFSYIQAGQENSFAWHKISASLPYQYERIVQLEKEGKVVVETMGETARRFKADHKVNCVQTQVALEDWLSGDRNSVWYNSRFYRANVFRNGERLYFRDIHKMCDDFAEPFLNTACKVWQACYFTPPVVDEHLNRKKGSSGVMTFDGAFKDLEVSADANDVLTVMAVRKDGTKAKIVLDERGIRVEGAELSVEWEPGFKNTTSFRDNLLSMEFQGFRYNVGVDAQGTPTDKGFLFKPRNGVVSFDLSR